MVNVPIYHMKIKRHLVSVLMSMLLGLLASFAIVLLIPLLSTRLTLTSSPRYYDPQNHIGWRANVMFGQRWYEYLLDANPPIEDREKYLDPDDSEPIDVISVITMPSDMFLVFDPSVRQTEMPKASPEPILRLIAERHAEQLDHGDSVIHLIQLGWPFSCATVSFVEEQTPRGLLGWISVNDEMPDNRPPFAVLGIPTNIAIGGLLMNMGVFAIGILSMLFVGNIVVRGWRRSRGRCTHCGYSLFKLRGTCCPECGSPQMLTIKRGAKGGVE